MGAALTLNFINFQRKMNTSKAHKEAEPPTPSDCLPLIAVFKVVYLHFAAIYVVVI